MHPVTFAQPFYLGRTEVTFREWDACVADGGCNGYRPADQGWGRETRPVINVSWQDAQAYVAWLSRRTGRTCRLPSEAEWEYAARAGTTTEYALPAPDGSDDIGGKGLANCVTAAVNGTASRPRRSGSFPANAWGLHDMHGNVFEWVEDCWHDELRRRARGRTAWLEEDGGDCGTRVLRGGSWDSDQDFARSADRVRDDPNDRDNDIGFRVVCSSPSSSTDH